MVCARRPQVGTCPTPDLVDHQALDEVLEDGDHSPPEALVGFRV